MLRIYMGKSAAGKDYFYRRALKEECLLPVISTTTRPMRPGEKDGVDYFFVDRKEFLRRQNKNQFLEWRSYKTSVGGKEDVWYYGSPLLKDINIKDYVIILDPDGVKDTLKAYGSENCFVYYVTADDKIRKERALSRGGFDENEWNRRLADDEIKFSENVIKEIEEMTNGHFQRIVNNWFLFTTYLLYNKR